MAQDARTEKLKALVQKITDLPTLPIMLGTIGQLMENPRTSAEELGRAISTDPSIASKVLKLVNSAFYGFPGRISTITQAIVIMGFSTVRNVVLTTSILSLIGKQDKQDGLDMEEFWLHSISTGAIAKCLASRQGLKCREEAFIGGILHDLGKVVLSQFLPREFEDILAHRARHSCLTIEAEIAVLGVSHQEIGGWLAEKWNLPKALTDVIRYHHNPEMAKREKEATRVTTIGVGIKEKNEGYIDMENKLIYLIHASDLFSRAVSPGADGDGRIPILSPQAWEAINMKEGEFEELLGACQEEVDKAKVFLQVL